MAILPVFQISWIQFCISLLHDVDDDDDGDDDNDDDVDVDHQ